jgi:ABC-type glycerol-3-phosphate transport system substrate-binding protein
MHGLAGLIAKLKKPQGLILAVIVVLFVLFLILRPRDSGFSAKYAGFDLGGASLGRTNTYPRYIERYASVPAATRDLPLDLSSYTSSSGVSPIGNLDGHNNVIRTEEKSFIEWTFRLEEDGLYNIFIEYYPLESRGINIERSLKINGETPFLGAERLVFSRVWGDAPGGRKQDNQGNEIRQAQIEIPVWERQLFNDPLGYTVEPYQFYFKAGTNTLRFEGVNEPAAIAVFTLKAPVNSVAYSDYISAFNKDDYHGPKTIKSVKVQGEQALRRSDPSLYPIYDRSSGATEPPSVAKIKLNMIGGQSWRMPGQWIEWEFNAPEKGLYRFSVKGRQNYNRGFVSNRSVLIDGAIPCAELSVVPFMFNNRWKLVTFRDSEGQELYFPLEKGRHTLRMQVTLGELGEMLNVMEESVYRLNDIYRKILVLTGPEPDIFRDYRIDFVYPEVMKAMDLESKILYKLADDLTAYSGERSAQTAVALTIARQLEILTARPDKIPGTLVNFKKNISALGDSLLGLSQSQLDVDYFVVSAPDSPKTVIHDNIFIGFWHELRSFIASFFVDYNNLGDVYRKNRDVVEVWMLAGRDQSAILKAMIDDTFTPNTRIRVNVKLVAPDAVMPAVVAGTGPDVALTVPQADPVNYAVRKAAVDLSKFPGYDEITRQFDPSVLIPFEYAGGVYGLPETQYFHVMFYRNDIFKELDIPIPDTWEDLINIMPIIQKNNMNVGIPSVATTEVGRIDFSNFMAHLYQRHGTMYNEDGSRTMLASETAIEAFDVYTKFFTHYKTPKVFDFNNRFRTGEMPLGFADYTTFNTLEVFAPEIRGLWGFARMPGLKRGGAIDRSVPTGTLAAMIFSNAKNRELAWEFLKWWVSADTQVRFGRELESVMGAAARYPTANYDAFKRLSWGSDQMAVLDEQRSWTVGTPEVPGGYFVTRHLINAVRRILNESEDTRETMLDYSLIINDELIKKRKEFGLE